MLGVLPASAELLAQAQKTGATAGASKTAAKAEGGKVDMKPIKAFLTRARRLNEEGKLDLSKPQAITVEGDRQQDGTLSNVSITGGSSSDPNFRRVAEDFVTSVNQSHALQFLDGVSHMRMTFTLDGERFRADTASDTPTEQRADEMARGYRMLVNFARIAKRGTDEGAILNNMKISSSGKQLLMSLDMPREQMGNILLRQITPN
jgi:pyruvate/2-oxoglutarate dehydrogenase complex dihydrolipoamide acyltransferase (E2) component